MVDFEEQPEWQPYRHNITNRAVNQIRMKETEKNKIHRKDAEKN